MLQKNTKTGKSREIRVTYEEKPKLAAAKSAPRPATGGHAGPAAEQALHGMAGGGGRPSAHGHAAGHHGDSRPSKPGGGYAAQPGYVVQGRPISSPAGGHAGGAHGHARPPYGAPGSPPYAGSPGSVPYASPCGPSHYDSGHYAGPGHHAGGAPYGAPCGALASGVYGVP